LAKEKILKAGFVPNWCSFAGALHGALRAVGGDPGVDAVMGLTGWAFRIAVNEGPEGLIDDGVWLAANHEASLDLYSNLGYEIDWLHGAGEEALALKDHAVKRIRKSLDGGLPVVAFGLHTPEYGLIRGYNDNARTLLVSTMSQEQTGEVLPLAQWPPAPERRLDLFFPGMPRAVDKDAALMAALNFACDLAERGEGPEFERMTGTSHGFQAFELWAEALAEGRGRNTRAHAHNAQVVLSARRHAASFLRGEASGQGSARLEAAASGYQKEVLEWSQFCSLFPYPGVGEIEGTAALSEAAGYLRRALIHERVAIDHLREFVGRS
jgi:hypothetical protein